MAPSVQRRKVWLTPTTRCRAVTLPKYESGRLQRKVVNFEPAKNSVTGQEPPKMYMSCTSPGDGQTPCKVWLASVERRRCSNEAKTRNPLKCAGRPKLTKRSQPLVGRSSPYCKVMWRRYCCLISFLPIVDTCVSCEDIARQSSAMVPRWRFLATFFASCICSEPPAAHFRPAF